MLLDECKYVVKEIKMPEYITHDTENSCDDSDGEDLDYFNRHDSDEKISSKESSFE